MNKEITKYNNSLVGEYSQICIKLENIIKNNLQGSECKIYHGHPVWFLNGNPIVGYSKLKNGIELLFWSGQSFSEDKLLPSGKFKAANIFYNSVDEIIEKDIQSWLLKANSIQWDYKNIVKNKGILKELK